MRGSLPASALPVERHRPGPWCPQHAQYSLRQFAAFERNAPRRRLEPQRVPHFERSESVRVAPAHGAVDFDDAIRNLRHHLGGVANMVAQQSAREIALLCRRAPPELSGARPAARFCARFRAKRNAASPRGDIRKSSGRARGSRDPCPRACRSPGRACRPASRAESSRPRTVRCWNCSRNGSLRNCFVEILRHVLPDVEPDDVEQPVAGALGQPDQRPGERVHFLDREIVFDGQALHRGAEERADPVGDEVRRVFARHDALAEMAVAEIGRRTRTISGRVSAPGIISTRCR